MNYETFWLHLYGQDTGLALREHDWQKPATRAAAGDRVTEAFSRWLQGMEEALDRKARAREAAHAALQVQPVFILDKTRGE
jgi:hypothetical protein